MPEEYEELEVIVDIEDEDDDGQEDNEQFAAALNELQKRCAAAGIKYDPLSEEPGGPDVTQYRIFLK